MSGAFLGEVEPVFHGKLFLRGHRAREPPVHFVVMVTTQRNTGGVRTFGREPIVESVRRIDGGYPRPLNARAAWYGSGETRFHACNTRPLLQPFEVPGIPQHAYAANIALPLNRDATAQRLFQAPRIVSVVSVAAVWHCSIPRNGFLIPQSFIAYGLFRMSTLALVPAFVN